MFKKGLRVAVLAACVMGAAASATQAGALDQQKSLLEMLIGGATSPDPVTNPPGPKPPPRLDGGPKGPTPPPKLDGGSKGTLPPPK